MRYTATCKPWVVLRVSQSRKTNFDPFNNRTLKRLFKWIKISKNKLCTIIKKTEKDVPSTPRQRNDRLPESPRPTIHSFLLKAHGLAMKTTSDRSKRTQKLLSKKQQQQRPCKLITIWECTCLSLLVELMNSDFVQLVHLLGYVNRKRACQIRERHITLSHAGKRKWQT